ncbi:hypothetical protein ACEZCY_30875 [Streptacidiphilus sp. N1-12]|uniref:Uncharacterized protein n=2 Tax=Streptacidiphilus alkalitolerans TaxID=3342712 RepID=A0ABV6VI70_9ACTN
MNAAIATETGQEAHGEGPSSDYRDYTDQDIADALAALGNEED